jgi:hypothetical protein
MGRSATSAQAESPRQRKARGEDFRAEAEVNWDEYG